MKKVILFLIVIIMTFSQIPVLAQAPKGIITLSHQGETTTFGYNEMSKVMDEAEDGDTVLLSAGDFEGDFILTKKIAFIGVGADGYNTGWDKSTRYTGKIIIQLPEDTKLTARLFDGIYFTKGGNESIIVNSSIDNMIFRKCQWRYNLLNCDKGKINSLLIDRCNCKSIFWSENCSKMIVKNSILEEAQRENWWIDPTTRLYYNCNISATAGYQQEDGFYSNLMGTFYNCIINNSSNYITVGNGRDKTILINCLYLGAKAKGCITSNCYEANFINTNVLELSKEELKQKGYLGNDGTIVGCYGGKNPYTLSYFPNINSQAHLDKDKKQIQFNIKVTE